MQILDYTYPTPADNLACDEALLDLCEDGQAQSIIRFWESKQHFVVLGYSCKQMADVNLNISRALNIPVFRRCSGGGTVLQGPGCLNVSLIVDTLNSESFKNLSSTHRFISSRHRSALTTLIGKPITIQGTSDLAIDQLKFSGSAQRRKRRFALFHATFLLSFQLELISEVLYNPTRQPAYRRKRSHDAFVMNLPVEPERLKNALLNSWGANTPLQTMPHERVKTLVREKYALSSWNDKF